MDANFLPCLLKTSIFLDAFVLGLTITFSAFALRLVYAVILYAMPKNKKNHGLTMVSAFARCPPYGSNLGAAWQIYIKMVEVRY